MTDRYAVFGNPIAHSQSPWIHARFAEATGQELSYERQLVALDGFAAAVQQFFAEGGRGLNITVPFKEQAWLLCGSRSPAAESAGAVNTLQWTDGRLHGDNTDGIGLRRDIENNLGQAIQGRRILILGAGGAVRGVLRPLLEAQPAALTIANRTVAKAQALTAGLTGFCPVDACGFSDCAGRQFDIVINGTSSGLQGEMPALPEQLFVRDSSLAYDMVYGREATPFMRWAATQGAGAVSDGLGMLVEQAAESFRLWRGVRPATAEVMAGLRSRLAAPA